MKPRALLSPERDTFWARYKFDVRPATDDKPYFFHFFKWRSLPEFLALKGRGGLPFLEWGYPVLIATLLQATLTALALILVPLWVMTRRQRTAYGSLLLTATSRGDAPPSAATISGRRRVAIYFVAVGFAFIFIEIAFIQKFVLLLSHPLYAVAVVLCAFLSFAGLGSRYTQRLQGREALLASHAPRSGRNTNRRSVTTPIVAISAISLFYLFVC